MYKIKFKANLTQFIVLKLFKCVPALVKFNPREASLKPLNSGLPWLRICLDPSDHRSQLYLQSEFFSSPRVALPPTERRGKVCSIHLWVWHAGEDFSSQDHQRHVMQISLHTCYCFLSCMFFLMIKGFTFNLEYCSNIHNFCVVVFSLSLFFRAQTQRGKLPDLYFEC